jgi:glyoxylase-like metal-dependent hydrolase (beta-lactamase superfamily II)
VNLSPMQVGDTAIHPIFEMAFPYADPFKFFPGLQAELWDANRAWLEPHAVDPATGMLVLSFQSYVVKTKEHTILVDTCAGNDKNRPGTSHYHMLTSDTYMRSLSAAGFRVEDIDYVMCTHMHMDHVGWNTRLQNGRWMPTFPNARYLFSQQEYDYWMDRNKQKAVPAIVDSVLPVVEAGLVDVVSNEHAVSEQIRLMPTPGHTIDHCAVCVSSRSQRAVFTGDLTHSPLQLRYPELSMRADYDQGQAAQTRRRFFEDQHDAEALVCTMHYPHQMAGRLERWGDGFRFRKGG